MEEYAGHLDHFCRNSEVIGDTIFEAQEVAEYLLVEMRAYPGHLADHRASQRAKPVVDAVHELNLY
jgi:hypothetical protein